MRTRASRADRFSHRAPTRNPRREISQQRRSTSCHSSASFVTEKRKHDVTAIGREQVRVRTLRNGGRRTKVRTTRGFANPCAVRTAASGASDNPRIEPGRCGSDLKGKLCPHLTPRSRSAGASPWFLPDYLFPRGPGSSSCRRSTTARTGLRAPSSGGCQPASSRTYRRCYRRFKRSHAPPPRLTDVPPTRATMFTKAGLEPRRHQWCLHQAGF
ncbi:MAG: hypothetical protein QOE32_1644 [Pseudonocardiales bacterium]|nr:hypothetical protein [Pseudonocardiales bacterium]